MSNLQDDYMAYLLAHMCVQAMYDDNINDIILPLCAIIQEENLIYNVLLKSKLNPIEDLLTQVSTKEARNGILHAQKIMDMIIFHSEVQENKDKLTQEWRI
jgi:hypothetical protein